MGLIKKQFKIKCAPLHFRCKLVLSCSCAFKTYMIENTKALPSNINKKNRIGPAKFSIGLQNIYKQNYEVATQKT